MRYRPGVRTLGVLGVCLALLAAGVVAGVAGWTRGWKGSVTLLANWGGTERATFMRDVIEPFQEKYRIKVVYQGSPALSHVLAADIDAGGPPDVAVLPGPGELLAYAREGRLQALDGLFDADQYDSIWAPKVKRPGAAPHTYWLPVKTGLKSMVWHAGKDVPGTAEGASRWCMGMESGATSGWPGTDWVEDILLQRAGPETYTKWATGRLSWTSDTVRGAWQTWGEMTEAGDERATALTTPYNADCPAGRWEHQGSFRAGAWLSKEDAGYVHSAEVIPGARRGAGAWEVSGDLAALLNPTGEARELMRFLADPHTVLPAHTANKEATPDEARGRAARRMGGILRGKGSEIRCWDASDMMPRALRDAFHQAVLRCLVEPSALNAELRKLEDLRRKEQKLPVCTSG